ncbi:MAG: type VI secretion system-associated protein TagO [Pseudomonadota bacterium]
MIRFLRILFVTLIGLALAVIGLLVGTIWLDDAVDREVTALRSEQSASESPEEQTPWRLVDNPSTIDTPASVYLTSSAPKAPPVGRFQLNRPELTIRCKENATSLYVSFGAYIGRSPLPVTTRLDEAEARTAPWQPASSYKALGLWDDESSIPFLKEMFGKEQLELSFTPPDVGEVTTSFPIAGLAEEIAPLRKACNW